MKMSNFFFNWLIFEARAEIWKKNRWFFDSNENFHIHGAGKTAKQIKKIAVTSNIDFLNHYNARMPWKKKKISITFQENSILLKS